MKKGTKRIKTWIKYFPEDVQEKIANNIREQGRYFILKEVVGSQSEALLSIFTWFDTDESKGEGFNYWNNIHEDLLSKGK